MSRGLVWSNCFVQCVFLGTSNFLTSWSLPGEQKLDHSSGNADFQLVSRLNVRDWISSGVGPQLGTFFWTILLSTLTSNSCGGLIEQMNSTLNGSLQLGSKNWSNLLWTWSKLFMKGLIWVDTFRKIDWLYPERWPQTQKWKVDWGTFLDLCFLSEERLGGPNRPN